MGDNATGHCKPEGLRLMVDMAPEATPLGSDRSHQRFDAHTGHGREVDHHAAVTQRVAGYGVTPASDRDRQVPLPSEAHGGHHVSCPGATRDDGRLTLDVPVPDPAGGLEPLITLLEHSPREACDVHHGPSV
jgi:hypothetical protein